MRSLSIQLIFCVFLFNSIAADEHLNEKQCSTKCSVTFDKTVKCFDETLQFFQQTLMGTMRQYVHVQQVISTLNNAVTLDPDVAANHAENSMKKMKIYSESNMNEMYSPEDAKDVVRKLTLDVNAKFVDLPVTCPGGCETSLSPWLPIFIASATLNIVFFLLAAGTMLLATKREERQAAKIFQEALITTHGIKKD
ncbi:unnamed protein product, partial [Mesorhabditis belari]|uniref:Uncharacterized protein n=1 Tax=Mesorhabditis belari TaxID=2138241 RepID=A0AAF3J5H4_9BILA